MSTRLCPSCGTTKDLTDFPISAPNHRFESQRRHRYCKECKAAKMRALAHTRRDEWLKANGPCVQCGSSIDLEMDHIDPTTKDSRLTTQGFWTWSAKRRETELVKCQVLCKDCHKDKTIKQFSNSDKGLPKYRRKSPNHGSRTEYENHGCRCDICVNFIRQYWRSRERKRS